MNEREYFEELVKDAEDTVSFLSNERKQERERSVCAAFLRCLGIEFSTKEIKSSEDEPPDVVFRDARFEVREILNKGRRRHDEMKAKRERLSNAKTSDDVLEPPPKLPVPLPYEKVIGVVTSALNRKAQRYSQNVRANLDALVYVNLVGKFLDIDSPLPSLDPLRSQEWRSVSIFFHSSALVLYAKPLAPAFLRNVVGRTMAEWNSPFGLFNL